MTPLVRRIVQIVLFALLAGFAWDANLKGTAYALGALAIVWCCIALITYLDRGNSKDGSWGG